MAISAAENAAYPGDVTKVEISLPEDLLSRIDGYAERSGETRSDFLRRLAEREIAAHNARRRKEFEELLGPPLPPGTDPAQMIREERDNDLWH
jgi:hypothetical protein